MRILIHWFITSVALVVAAWLVPGIRVEREAWTVFAAMAIILGLVNAIVRPLLKFMSCPLIILTLGLFVLVINGIDAVAGLGHRGPLVSCGLLRRWLRACVLGRADREHRFGDSHGDTCAEAR